VSDVLTNRALNRATLARQMLLKREKITVVRAVERLAGLQAQLARPPFIGLWSRLQAFRPEHLQRAATDRKVVRATLMRGTLHLVSTKDYLVLRPVLQPMLSASMEGVLGDRTRGFDLGALKAATRACLAERPGTFEEIRAALRKSWPEADERAMGYTVRMHLPLVQVPTDTRWGWPSAAAFAVADSWIGARVGEEGDPRDLVLRYLAAFGPASVRDAETWSYLKGLGPAFEALRPKLRVFHDERGRELFDLPKAPRPPEKTPAPVRFLPDYDNLLLSHADRKRVIADAHRPRVATANLRLPPTFLVDGFAAGTWSLARARATASLRLEPFEPIPRPSRAALVEEGEALARFLEPEASKFEVRFA
jgi:hypothetical protein